MCRYCIRSPRRTIFLPDLDQPGLVIEPLPPTSEFQDMVDFWNRIEGRLPQTDESTFWRKKLDEATFGGWSVKYPKRGQ
ncbi:MAG: hypothetical protein KGL39_28870 [Patescibacteria group bacterium]|nr:hypothetical protein [Patescibacteria group bacterium]